VSEVFYADVNTENFLINAPGGVTFGQIKGSLKVRKQYKNVVFF